MFACLTYQTLKPANNHVDYNTLFRIPISRHTILGFLVRLDSMIHSYDQQDLSSSMNLGVGYKTWLVLLVKRRASWLVLIYNHDHIIVTIKHVWRIKTLRIGFVNSVLKINFQMKLGRTQVTVIWYIPRCLTSIIHMIKLHTTPFRKYHIHI